MSTDPRMIGTYELQKQLGNSEVAETWKAFDTQGKHYVALKLLHPNLQADPAFIPRFIQETRAISNLNHPNIVKCTANWLPSSTEPIAYLAADYIEGITLAEFIKNTSRQGSFPNPTTLLGILSPICAALDYAHQQGVLHGNLKPGNILLDKLNTTHNTVGEPMITDFGTFSLFKTPPRPLTSLYYLSPEQAQGYIGSNRSDIYALGVILYEMCTGVLPFEGDTVAETMMQHVSASPTAPSLINPNLPPALTAVILRSLAKDPTARFATATDLLKAVARAINMPIPAQEGQSQLSPSMDTMNSPTFITPIHRPEELPGGYAYRAGTNPRLEVPTARTPQLTPQQAQPSALITPLVREPVTQAIMPASAQINTQPANLPAPSLPTPAPVPAPEKRRFGWPMITLLVLLLIVLIGSSLGAYFIFFDKSGNASSPTPTASTTNSSSIVGHAFFVSSGLLSPNSSQGIADRVQINMDNIPPPPDGKFYCAWLLSDKTVTYTSTFLGVLNVKNNTAQLVYQDPMQTDLLAHNSHFLISLESVNTPSNPSLAHSDWVYYSVFSENPNPNDPKKFSLYDHLRHLLAVDPKLQAAGLPPGGLDIWLFRNTEKLVEWTGSARDSWKIKTQGSVDFIRRQLVRILDYLDSEALAPGDIPTGLPTLLADPVISRVALLTLNTQQEPPGYLKHIGTHLQEISTIAESTPDQRALAITIGKSIDNVQIWLNQVHALAKELIAMPFDQITGDKGRTDLDALANAANYAFVGQTDPQTNQTLPGVVQIHYDIQRLATFDIQPCTANISCS